MTQGSNLRPAEECQIVALTPDGVRRETFLIFALFCFAGLVFVARWVPETRNRNLYRATTRSKPAACGFIAVSGCSSVLVDHSAEDPVTLDWGVKWNDGCRIVVRGLLVETLVWTVGVKVSGVRVKDSACVSFVVDQDSVCAFLTGATYESFRVTVRLRCSWRNFDDSHAF